MKVCLTTRENKTWESVQFSNVSNFNRSVDDGEVTELMCDYFLSSFGYEEIPKIMSLILRKVRVGGEVMFNDYDWKNLSNQIVRGVSLEDVNQVLMGHNFKCVLAMEEIEKLIFLPLTTEQ